MAAGGHQHRITGQKLRCQQRFIPSRGSREESISLPFPAEMVRVPWVVAPFLHLQSQTHISLTLLLYSHLPLTSAKKSSPILRIRVTRLGPLRLSRIIPISRSLIIFAKSIHHISYNIHRFWRLGRGHLWGRVIWPLTTGEALFDTTTDKSILQLIYDVYLHQTDHKI